MATYFPTSNNQPDATPMHYLRESLPTSYSEAPIISGNTMMYMNYSSSSGPCTDTIGENSQQHNSCNETTSVSDFGGSRFGERDFNGWGRDINEMPFMQLMGGATSALQGVHHLQGQGLSLSLSTQIPSTLQLPSVEYQIPNSGFASFLSPNMSIPGEGSGRSVSVGGNSDSMKMDISSYGMWSNIERTIPNSKYLKAVQQLLDEVVNARIALKRQDCKNDKMTSSKEVDEELKSETKLPPSSGVSSNPQESISNSPSELSAAERQDLQNKLTKLLSMLDEIDKRYKKYYHQMQIVVSSFDVIAGRDAAKPYTALALQTISRHFRCLRDAINGQIRVTRRGLGDQDASENSKGVGISRLRYVDQQLRQQKVLQQFGLMQQHAWRPQRGLPENSVSILRAWLFEHFLHPYPKDSEKIILARQTGLTKSQISNWFINARVRLWKPMVEDMYKEEIDDADVDSNSSEAPPKATKSDTRTSEDRAEELHQSATSKATDQHSTDATFHSGIQIGIETKYQYGVVKSREEQRPGVDVFPDAIVQSDGGSGRLMETAAYNRSELGRFGNGSSVSLTLGLQHCEGVDIPMSVETHHSFITMRGDDIYNAASSSMGSTADFDYLDSGNLQRRFGSSHLLHDFVA